MTKKYVAGREFKSLPVLRYREKFGFYCGIMEKESEHSKIVRWRCKMKYVTAGKMKEVSAIIQGCMRLHELSENQVEQLMENDLELGINFFDHADVYGGGVCEEMFGNVLKKKPLLRDQMFLQSKCGIVKGNGFNYFDFSKEYIVKQVDMILKRLHADYLDSLLLHRPDALMEPEEVAAAFNQLEAQGKVRNFGVSNQNPMQIELLKTCVKQPLKMNQMQLSVVHSCMIDEGIQVNTMFQGGANRDGSVLNYSRINGITIQCWSPFQYGAIKGTFMDHPDYPEVNQVLQDLAEKYGGTKSSIAIAWLLRHPAKMQVIAGSCNEQHMKDIVKACEITLSREDWYRIYKNAGNVIP